MVTEQPLGSDSNKIYLLLLGALVPPSALDLLGCYVDEHSIDTPYGTVGPLARRSLTVESPIGAADDAEIAHRISCYIQPYTGLPTRTDPRSTLFAARELGVTSVISWDMGIALNPALTLGQTVVATDYIDRMRHQPPSFGMYVEQADGQPALPPELLFQIQQAGQQPIQLVEPALSQRLNAIYARHQRSLYSAVYLGLDGPRREAPAEAKIYRRWGADVLGYNLIPEVFLAHELGLAFTGIITVRDYSTDLASTATAAQRQVAVQAGAIPSGIEQALHALAELISSK